ncbi:agouti-signaling protein-like [Corythoichthys intestinalis]|uniref:agouti-signaling protein-like n=1 Tax=Corythoichthys intestinalis TaxID=161448 RepID=UPI0025A54B6B|nr:agouti-signaling protein-like [Corythoichthys intestinalis]XP_061809873.1 agouti-signaling protein-like [Nerophis lumbriciformis]
MKLSVLCLCVLHLMFVSAGLLTSNDLQSGSSDMAKISRRAGGLPSKYRTLFARRGQYEQQKLLMMRTKGMPDVPKDSKDAQKPASAVCSQLGQSCLPQQGCCEPCSTCHCHFFKAICFCRRINMQCIKNT